MRTVIFIDGENLHYSLKDMKLMERDIHWSNFLQHCLSPGDSLIRAYWYQAAKLNNPRVHPERARKFINQSLNAPDGNSETEIEQFIQEANVWKEEQERKYKRKLAYYDNLSIQFPKIEMVRRGIVKIDPFQKKYIGEKGLDVALAIGMVERQEYCDKVILISGDLDYAEVIRFVKDRLKQVHIVRLCRGEPPTNRSVAKHLRELADKVIDLYETEIRNSMLQ